MTILQNIDKKINKKLVITILVICLLCLLVLTAYLLIKSTNIDYKIELFSSIVAPNIRLLPNETLATAEPSNYLMYGPSVGNNGRGGGEVQIQYILPEKRDGQLTGRYGFIVFDNTFTPALGSFVKIVRSDGLQLYQQSTGTFPGFDSQTNPTFFEANNYIISSMPTSAADASYLIKPSIPIDKTIPANRNDLPNELKQIVNDFGYPNLYRKIINLHEDGKNPSDFIRYAGDDNKTLYTALSGDTTEYSISERVVYPNGQPYSNNLDRIAYSLRNPNNNRTIFLNSPYAVDLYNRLNGTNYTYNGQPVVISPPTANAPTTNAPTTTLAPTTTNAPTTTQVPTTTNAPTTTLAPTTTNAPTTTRVPTTTNAPTTTPAPTTTKAPTTTPAPTTTKAPTTTRIPTTTLPPTTTQVPTTTKFNCNSYMGNILQTLQQNIINCNNDNNNSCYYLGGNCLNASESKDISNAELSCFITPKNPDSNSGPYIYDFICNNKNKDDKNFYLIKSIEDNNKNILYQTGNINNSAKSNIPYIYNGSLQNLNEISLKNKNIGSKITITDIVGKTKDFELTNNYITDSNSQTINAPNNSLILQMQALGNSINNNISSST